MRDSFVVWDNRIERNDLSFVDFLKSEGFSAKRTGYNPYTPWVFIDIVDMVYICGKPGVKFANAIGEHMISVDEFKLIWNIFKTYKGREFRDVN